MVRTYVRKTERGIAYSTDDLLAALDFVKSGRGGVIAAARQFKIPKSTIVDHLKGRRGVNSSSFGRATAISHEEEVKLAEGLKYLEKYGHGLTKCEILHLVAEYIKENKIKNPFKDDRPSCDWFVNFKRRHNLTLIKSQNLKHARKKSCDPFIVKQYFSLLKECIENLGLVNKPNRIWNLDETSFCKSPSETKIIGAIGVNSLSGQGKENIRVLFACNAAGVKVPPLIIFKGKNVLDEWKAPDGTGFPGMTYAATENGWMESRGFENYFQNTLLEVFRRDEEEPQLLIYDGHETHVSLKLVEMARQANVTVLKLPPHSSHILQPLNLVKWDEDLVSWQKTNIGRKLPKGVFSQIIDNLWKELNPNDIQSGFRKAGIVPFNDSVISSNDQFGPDAKSTFSKKSSANTSSHCQATSCSLQFPVAGPSNASISSASPSEVTRSYAMKMLDFDIVHPVPNSSKEELRTCPEISSSFHLSVTGPSNAPISSTSPSTLSPTSSFEYILS